MHRRISKAQSKGHCQHCMAPFSQQKALATTKSETMLYYNPQGQAHFHDGQKL